MPNGTIMRRYRVVYASGSQYVEAAYWQSGSDTLSTTPDGLIRFKDAGHKTVFAVRADLVETITELRDEKPAAASDTCKFTCTCTGPSNVPNRLCPFHGSPTGTVAGPMVVTL